MSNIIFLNPWILLLTLLLPILWWIMRLTPPRPKVIEFPAFFLIKDLDETSNVASHSPLWLLILRSLMLLAFIIAFAEPVIKPAKDIVMPNRGAVLIAVDNSWAAASNWQSRIDRVADYINKAKRDDVDIKIITTAKSAKNAKIEEFDLMHAEEALNVISRIKPQPWVSDYDDVVVRIDDISRSIALGRNILFSSGLYAPDSFAKKFDEVVLGNKINDPYILKLKDNGREALKLSLIRRGEDAQKVKLVAYDVNSNLLDEMEIDLPKSALEHEFEWKMLPEFKDKLSRIEVKLSKMASSTLLFKQNSKNYVVGVVTNSDIDEDRRELLQDHYYIRKALNDDVELELGGISDLLDKDLSLIILADSAKLNPDDRLKLEQWVKAGGFLVRFSGSNLAANIKDNLLPIELRYGERSTSGSMTWEDPLKLGAIDANSPLADIAIADDVLVNSQILATPSVELFEKTWLNLEDGTPLITSDKFGEGRIVLVHTTANPKWSNFCYSGAFVEVLKRVVLMSEGVGDYKAVEVFKPIMLQDAFGNLHDVKATSIARTIDNEAGFELSPYNPPGVYGDKYSFKIYNLSDYLYDIPVLGDLPFDVDVSPYNIEDQESNLKSIFIKIALALLIVETLSVIWVRGILASLLFALVIITANPAVADDRQKEAFDPINNTYLAYIKTGDADVDKLSYHGLRGLGDVINTRTAINIKGISAIDPNKSEMIYYPFIYWPMSMRQVDLSMNALNNIQNYLLNGGVILFDTLDQNLKNNGIVKTIGVEKLREVTIALQIPELIKVPKEHIITKSFYLLDEFPGLYAGGDIWVEKEPNADNDNITSTVIGSNNWAAAWSKDLGDMARYVIEPGGEDQREQAYKFGVNLLMISLAGNYKGDQIHIPHILKRMNK